MCRGKITCVYMDMQFHRHPQHHKSYCPCNERYVPECHTCAVPRPRHPLTASLVRFSTPHDPLHVDWCSPQTMLVTQYPSSPPLRPLNGLLPCRQGYEPSPSSRQSWRSSRLDSGFWINLVRPSSPSAVFLLSTLLGRVHRAEQPRFGGCRAAVSQRLTSVHMARRTGEVRRVLVAR